MTTWASGLAIGLGFLSAVAFTAEAWGQFHKPNESVVLLSAHRLGALRRHPVSVPAGGAWHVWAWQRGGEKVEWQVAAKTFSATATPGKGGAFAWVKLGRLDLSAGKDVPVVFTPRASKDKQPLAGALLLTREAKCDPERLWRLTRVYPNEPASAADERLGQCRHLNMRMTMPTCATKAAWERRAAWLREHVRVSSGLVPEPPRTPLKAQVFGRLERDGYTIEKAFIESRPGFYCTGNLYRPKGKKGPLPGVASPHGHWGQGRFGHEPPGGSVPARCITLARLGYVVFAYDMVGYNDSARQVGKHRGVFASDHNELWGLSTMHLQSWNTIRAIDFLQSLADVDPKRIALTGCSGGGTQTFMVMGIDPRVTAAAPVCMISGTMQGGCECENSPLLRIETNNIEIGALMAPRPMIVPSATGDWTRETPEVELPSIRSVYELYGAADRTAGVHTKSGHGYNKAHREGVYTFFRRWVEGVADGKKVTEPPYEVEKKEDLLVFRGRKLPAGAKDPKTLKEYVISECRRQRDELLPKAAGDRKRFEETLGVAYRHAILAALPKVREVVAHKLGTDSVGAVQITRLLLGRKGAGDQVPAILYHPKSAGNLAGCLVVHPDGKAGLIDPATARPGKLLKALLAGGRAVLAIDTYLTGEFLSPVAETKQKKTGGFFSTYNRTPVVQRVQDILTALAYLRARKDVAGVGLVGTGKAGAWCMLAAPFAPEGTSVVADMDQLAGDEDPRWLGDLFTPLILKAGDVRTAAALAAPRRLLLHNVAGKLDTKPMRSAYRACGEAKLLRLEARRCGADTIVGWLNAK